MATLLVEEQTKVIRPRKEREFSLLGSGTTIGVKLVITFANKEKKLTISQGTELA